MTSLCFCLFLIAASVRRYAVTYLISAEYNSRSMNRSLDIESGVQGRGEEGVGGAGGGDSE